MPADELPKASGDQTRDWLFGYDVLEDSRRVLDEYLERRSVSASL